jgi:hypothetical protein
MLASVPTSPKASQVIQIKNPKAIERIEFNIARKMLQFSRTEKKSLTLRAAVALVKNSNITITNSTNIGEMAKNIYS